MDMSDIDKFARMKVDLMSKDRLLNIRKPIDNVAVAVFLRSHLFDCSCVYEDDDGDTDPFAPITEEQYTKRHVLFLKAIRESRDIRFTEEEMNNLTKYTRAIIEGLLGLGMCKEEEL